MGDGWGGEEQEAARIAEEDMDGEPLESGKQSLTLMLCCKKGPDGDFDRGVPKRFEHAHSPSVQPKPRPVIIGDDIM